MQRDIYELPFEGLTLEEQIIRTTSGKLIKHFRGLEDANFIDREAASSMIGTVKKLAAVALEAHWAVKYPHSKI